MRSAMAVVNHSPTLTLETRFWKGVESNQRCHKADGLSLDLSKPKIR